MSALDNFVVDCCGILPEQPALSRERLTQLILDNLPAPIIKAEASSHFDLGLIHKRLETLHDWAAAVNRGERPAADATAIQEEIVYLTALREREAAKSAPE